MSPPKFIKFSLLFSHMALTLSFLVFVEIMGLLFICAFILL